MRQIVDRLFLLSGNRMDGDRSAELSPYLAEYGASGFTPEMMQTDLDDRLFGFGIADQPYHRQTVFIPFDFCFGSNRDDRFGQNCS